MIRYVAVFAVLLAGCHSSSTAPPPFKGSADDVQRIADDTERLAQESSALAVKIEQAHPQEAEARLIQDKQHEIVLNTNELHQQAKGIRAGEKQYDKVAKENGKLKDAADKANRALWGWMQLIGSLVMVLGGLGAAYFIPKAAPYVAAAGAGLVAVATFMLSYSFVVNLIVGALVILGGVLVGLGMWHKYKIEERKADAPPIGEAKP